MSVEISNPLPFDCYLPDGNDFFEWLEDYAERAWPTGKLLLVEKKKLARTYQLYDKKNLTDCWLEIRGHYFRTNMLELNLTTAEFFIKKPSLDFELRSRTNPLFIAFLKKLKTMWDAYGTDYAEMVSRLDSMDCWATDYISHYNPVPGLKELESSVGRPEATDKEVLGWEEEIQATVEKLSQFGYKPKPNEVIKELGWHRDTFYKRQKKVKEFRDGG